jgi:glycosyltransferase involved in cell wall biosynthesis
MPAYPDVLFLSRLHLRKRPMAFVEMARQLIIERTNATFSIAGADEGELARVEAALERHGLTGVVRYEGAVRPENVVDRISRCTILVLPSVAEPFPMVVLEALASGRPVVVTGSCGLAPLVDFTRAGTVTDGSVQSLVSAVRKLLVIPGEAARAGSRGLNAVQEDYSMSRVIDQWQDAVFHGALPINGNSEHRQ